MLVVELPFIISIANKGINVNASSHELKSVRLTTQNKGDEISPMGVWAKANGKKADAVVSEEINKGMINTLQE